MIRMVPHLSPKKLQHLLVRILPVVVALLVLLFDQPILPQLLVVRHRYPWPEFSREQTLGLEVRPWFALHLRLPNGKEGSEADPLFADPSRDRDGPLQCGELIGQIPCHSFFVKINYAVVENGESLECALRYFVECLMRLSQKTH